MPASMITPHFSYAEMTATQVRGVVNTPDGKAMVNLTRVCEVMEKVRSLFGAPINIHSGFRCDEVNRRVGGVPNSAHRFGAACDFDIGSWGSIREVYNRLQPYVKQWDIDQLIDEYDGWVHIGLWFPGLTDSNGQPVAATRHMIFEY
jgi:zinc D-Ala-D-Ala carboxypeptidase